MTKRDSESGIFGPPEKVFCQLIDDALQLKGDVLAPTLTGELEKDKSESVLNQLVIQKRVVFRHVNQVLPREESLRVLTSTWSDWTEIIQLWANRLKKIETGLRNSVLKSRIAHDELITGLDDTMYRMKELTVPFADKTSEKTPDTLKPLDDASTPPNNTNPVEDGQIRHDIWHGGANG